MRINRHEKIVKVWRKNCDKFITPTDRVSCWAKIRTISIAGTVTLKENLKVPAKETDLSWNESFKDD